MEKQIVKWMSTLVITSCLLCMGLMLVPGLHTYAIRVANKTNITESKVSVMDLLRDSEEVVTTTASGKKETFDHQLRLELPDNVDAEEVTVNNLYREKIHEITIPGITSTYFYDFPMVGGSDSIIDLKYDTDEEGGIIDIEMDDIYELQTLQQGRYLYLDFVKPRDLYDYIVVIDAGHGGRMPGAVSNNGKVYEKNLCLAIVKQLKSIFDASEENIGVYYTRLDDSNPDFEDRVGLANDLNADAFVSVHINSTAGGNESYIHGTAVMYHVKDKTKASKKLAKNCLDGLLEEQNSLSKGLIKGDEIYIIRKAKVPVALAEVGFITNSKEYKKLRTESYQRKTARGIYNGIVKTLKENGKQTENVTQEEND